MNYTNILTFYTNRYLLLDLFIHTCNFLQENIILNIEYKDILYKVQYYLKNHKLHLI